MTVTLFWPIRKKVTVTMKNIPVLYEDHNLLVLNKPAGLPVQGGAGIGLSLDSLLTEFYKPRPLLVHRLDKDTSGIIVTAKTRECAAACSALFSDHGTDNRNGLQKTYLALCAGIVIENGAVNEPLDVKDRSYNALTYYASMGSSTLLDNKFSLLEINPATGRMHQIRRHLSQIGCPILGDDKYGNFALNKKLKKNLGLKRLLLHAASIYLPSVLVEGGIKIEAPLPEYFKEILRQTGLIFPL